MHSTWHLKRKLLCVRLDSAGDVLMTTPALNALKEAAPGRHLTLLTSPSGARAARLVPALDEIIEFEAPWLKERGADVASDRVLINRLAAGGYDAAIVFTAHSQSPLPAAYFVYLAGIRHCLAHCRESPCHLLSDRVQDPEPQQRVRHEARRQLDLVATTGAVPKSEALSIAIPSVARRRAAAALATLRVPRDGPLVVAHVGAPAAARRYPPHQFAEALDLLVAEQRARVVLTGDSNEVALVELVRGAMRTSAYTLAGCLDFAELCAVVEAADVLVSNNTLPVHIAAAVGTPVVDLYALTNPQHVPWRVPYRVLYRDVSCRYCYQSVCPAGHHACLAGVKPAEVADAVRALLDCTFEPVRAMLDVLPGANLARRGAARASASP